MGQHPLSPEVAPRGALGCSEMIYLYIDAAITPSFHFKMG